MIQTNFHNSTRQANVDQRRPSTPNNTRLPSDVWSQLLQDGRVVWMALSIETKALILGLTFPPVSSTKGNVKSMLHDISTF